MKKQKTLIACLIIMSICFILTLGGVMLYPVLKSDFEPSINNTENNTEIRETQTNNDDNIEYSDLSHCGLNRDEYASLLPEEIQTSAYLSQSQQILHLDDTLMAIQNNNIHADEIFNNEEFVQFAEDLEKRISEGIDTATYYLKLKELFSLIGDNHSTFLTPEEAEEYDNFFKGTTSTYSAGISLVTCVDPWNKDGAALITYVYNDSPAEKSGLKQFSLVTSINDVPAVVNGALNLQPGDELVRDYEILDTSGKTEEIAVQLADVTPTHVYYEDRISYDYFNIKAFTVSNINTFNDLYFTNSQNNTKPLVIDLRFNMGGDVYALEKLLNNFFDSNTSVGHTSSRIYNDDELVVGSSDPINNRDIYIWTWFLTDSASQIFTGIMQEEGKAKSIGIDLDGNVESISAITLYHDNSKVVNSIKLFIPRSGNRWDRVGIPADHQIGNVIWGTFTEENDPYHHKTLEIIKNI